MAGGLVCKNPGYLGSPEMTIDATASPATTDHAARPTPAPSVLSLVGPYPWIGFVGTVLIAASAPLWRLAGNEWRFSLPFIPHDGSRPYSTIVFLFSAALLTIAWVGLVRRTERTAATERERTRAVLLTCGLWFAPLLLGPPLLSSDIYSYAAQGEMVTKGFDPTSEGMYRLQTGDYVSRVDPIWRTPTVGNGYGPVQMGVAAAVVVATGHDANLTLWGLRLVALGGVALAGWGIMQIARHYGIDPPTALALGVANPITALHLIGGAHNDALLAGLLCAGIALALRGRWWWGVVLMAMATAVKLPAGAAILMMAWCHPGTAAAVRERLRSVAQAAAVTAGVIIAASAIVGVGFGWIDSMRNAATSKSTLAITTQLGWVVGLALRSLGFNANPDAWVDAFRLLGLAIAAGISLFLLVRSPKIGPVRAMALCLVAVAVLGPVVWPWYFAPALILVAAADLGRWRPAIMVLCVGYAVEVFPSSPGGTVPDKNHAWAALAVIAIGVIAVGSSLISGWRDELLTTDDDQPSFAG